MLERRILVSSLGRFDCDDLYNFRYLVAGDEDLSSQFDIAIRLAMTANVEVDQKKKTSWILKWLQISVKERCIAVSRYSSH